MKDNLQATFSMVDVYQEECIINHVFKEIHFFLYESEIELLAHLTEPQLFLI